MAMTKRECYSVNPFRIEHKHIGRIRLESDNITTGYRDADFQEHIRIFPEFHDDIELLSSMAIKILVFIFSELKKDVDEVYFDIDTFLRFTNRRKIGGDGQKPIRNKAGVYRGIDDLISRSVIARKAGDGKSFYINPAKFFPGTRVGWNKKIGKIPKEMRSILVDGRINPQEGSW
jgi:hypothetical protein